LVFANFFERWAALTTQEYLRPVSKDNRFKLQS
jgi:hypothetical protein